MLLQSEKHQNKTKKYTFMPKRLWNKTSSYLILTGVCTGILLLVLLVITILDLTGRGESINDSLAGGIVFFICIPGILIGTFGAIICKIRNKLAHKQ